MVHAVLPLMLYGHSSSIKLCDDPASSPLPNTMARFMPIPITIAIMPPIILPSWIMNTQIMIPIIDGSRSLTNVRNSIIPNAPRMNFTTPITPPRDHKI